MKKIIYTVLAFFAYYLLAKFGSMFTIFFGFASPIWPVSGVMLGLYLLYGRPILIGAFLASLFTLQQEPFISPLSTYVIFILTSISTLQLFIAKQLVLRYCSLPMNTHNSKHIINFLLLTGPLTVLISSLMFTVTLHFSLDIGSEKLSYIGLIKFVADLVSIIFITPIFLFIVENAYARKTRRSTTTILASLFTLSLISFIYILSSSNNHNEKQREFFSSTRPFVEGFNVIQTTIKNNLTALDGFFQGSNEVTRAEFEIFASKIITDELNLRALAWLPLITHQNREAFEANLSAQGFVNASIKQLTKQGVTLASKEAFYLPLSYTYPLDDNKSAIGLDVFTHPIVKCSVKKAIKSKKHIITPLLSLAQQQNKYTGVIVYYPIFKNTPDTQENTLQGVVEVVLELDVVFSALYRKMKNNNFTYQLSYGDNNVFTQPNYNVNSIFNSHLGITLFDKEAQLSFASTPEFELSLIDWKSLIFLIIGGVIGLICVTFVFFVVAFNSFLTRKVSESTTKLIKKNKELTNANQAKNLFLANISHEYRTPLNAIMGFTEIALREIKDKTSVAYFTQIEQSSNILLNIVNDVLDTSKIQAGELNLERRPFSPSVVTREVIDMLKETATEKSISINTSFTSSFELWVEGDNTRFKQIIINLLNNAIKFTHQGSISISGDSYSVNNDRTLTIEIKDTGIGISEEAQKRLFTPFAQATNSTTREYGGTGLGLSIVKQLCRLMNGNITLTSQFDVGSIFTVSIRLPKTEQPIEALSSQSNKSSPTCYKNTRILVVEDNKINQLIVKKQLDYKGIECDFADDGLLALSYLENKIPDLILMDLQMPNMDGFTASSFIKKNSKLQHIPIVILSASVSKEDKEKASTLGIHDFINKPFKQKDLMLILNKYLKIQKEKPN